MTVAISAAVGAVTAATTTGFLNVANGCPQISVEIDITTDPTTVTRAWTNITAYVRSATIKAGGRNHELQRSDAGTCTVLLDNRDGRFDPTKTTGPYYGGLRRMRWMRIRAMYGGVVYPRCQMLVTNYDQEWPISGKDAICTLQAVDAFKSLSLFDLQGTTFFSELTGTRIQNVLELASVPWGSLDVGKSTVVAVSEAFPEGSSALEHLRSIEETENGQVFANKSGVIEFHDRHHRLLDTTTVATIGDTSGEIPYRTSKFSDDDQNIWNRVRVTPANNDSQNATPPESADDASIAAYFERRLNRTLLTDDVNEAQAAADYLLYLYADPSPRLPAVDLLGQADVTKWASILALGNSDRLLWKRRPSTEGSARTISQAVIVEQVSDTIEVGKGWGVTLDLSPADKTAFWKLGVAGRSELGDTSRAAY